MAGLGRILLDLFIPQHTDSSLINLPYRPVAKKRMFIIQCYNLFYILDGKLVANYLE